MFWLGQHEVWTAGLIWNGEGVNAENAGERLYTRSERETLSRFPKTGAILFSIRTYIRPLQTFKQRPSDAARLSQVYPFPTNNTCIELMDPARCHTLSCCLISLTGLKPQHKHGP